MGILGKLNPFKAPGIGGGIRGLGKGLRGLGRNPLRMKPSELITAPAEQVLNASGVDRKGLSAAIDVVRDVAKAEVSAARDVHSQANEMRKDEMKVAGDVIMDTAKVLGLVQEMPAQSPAEMAAMSNEVAAGLNNSPNIRASGSADLAQMTASDGRRKKARQLSTTLGISA